jgi:hypothetical protein
MEINKITLIEKNKKILDEIKELIDTNSPIGFILKSNFILRNSYLYKVIILTQQMSLNYFFYKKKFYFTRNGIWYEYLTNNLELIKKDGKNDKSLININLAIIVGKTKMYKNFKRILKKYIKNQIITVIGDEKPENSEEYFNVLNNYHEDYQKIVNSNEKSNFYQILLTLCEYIFTYNKDEIYFKSQEEDISQDSLNIDEINDLILY